MGVIAENREKYISFNIDVVVDTYEDKNGDIKEKKIQLRFIDSIRFMASSLDSLSSNLVGVSNNEMCYMLQGLRIYSHR